MSDEQIAFALKQAELGMPAEEVRRKMSISDADLLRIMYPPDE